MTRLAFWRGPTGEPSRKDRHQFAPTSLLNDCISKVAVESGRLSWKWGNGSEFLDVISSSIVVIKDENPVDRDTQSRLCRTGLTKAIQAGAERRKLTPSDVLSAVDKEAAKHFRMPELPFAYVSGLSVDEWPSSDCISYDGCSIARLANRSTYVLNERLVRSLKLGPLGKHITDSNYQLVSVHCTDRTPEGAASKSRDALDLLRAIWTLICTRGSRSWGSTERPRPLGVFHTSAVSTVHKSDGEHVESKYWYDPAYPPLFELYKGFSSKSECIHVEETRVAVEERLSDHPFSTDVKECLRRYVRAIDGIDSESSFLHLWSLLEKVTVTGDKRYDETIRRAAWGLEDRELTIDFLRFCRLRRNRYVHASASTGSGYDLCQQLKEIVEQHLLQLIRNDFEVSSLVEYGDFLSLPATAEQLRSRKATVERAMLLMVDQEENLGGMGI